ncbi:MAG: hypothetical protein PW735_12105, partial [Acidobacteriaceae bacterium]|nr:hypothetical protein [Acidobacteriaceae bacterium]
LPGASAEPLHRAARMRPLLRDEALMQETHGGVQELADRIRLERETPQRTRRIEVVVLLPSRASSGRTGISCTPLIPKRNRAV